LWGVEKVRLHPQTPQGGLSKSLDFNKSPLGDLGVETKGDDFFGSDRLSTVVKKYNTKNQKERLIIK